MAEEFKGPAQDNEKADKLSEGGSNPSGIGPKGAGKVPGAGSGKEMTQGHTQGGKTGIDDDALRDSGGGTGGSGINVGSS